MKNTRIRKWVIVFGIELVVLVGYIFLCVKDYEKNYYEETFSQDQFYELSNYGIDTGYYMDASMGSGGQVKIGINGLSLKRGMYRINIQYECSEGGRFLMEYEHGRNEYSVSGDVWLEAIVTDRNVVVDVKQGNEPMKIVFQLPAEKTSGSYLLIRKLTISSDFTGCVRNIFYVCILLCLMNLGVILYWNRKKIKVAREDRFAIACMLGILVVSCIPMCTNYLTDAHDLSFHLARIEGIKNCLLNGDFPARIQPQWLNSHGYPVSVFYGDLFLYLPALLRLVGISLQNVYKIYVFVVNAATVGSAYWCFSKISGNKKAGILGSAVYVLNIYRLSNVYVRGAVGEYTAMIFFPIILYGLWHILKKDTDKIEKNIWVWLALGYLGVLNSHLISCVMVGLFTIIALLIFIRRAWVKERFMALLKAFCGLVAGGVWFLVPLAQYMSMEFISSDSNNFVFYRQEERGIFWAQFFSNFYDVNGTSVSVIQGMNGEMPITLGVTFLLLVLAVIILCIYDSKLIKCRKEFFAAVFMCMFAMWLCTNTFPFAELSKISKVVLMVIKSIQYPWRFLAIVALMESWIAALLVSQVDVEHRKAFYQSLFITVVVVFLINDASNLLGRVMNEGNVRHVYDEASLQSMWVSGGEYLYIGADVNDYRDEISNVGEEVEVSSWERKRGKIYLEIANPTEAEKTLEIPMIYYYGCKAWDMDTKEEIHLDVGQSHRIRVKISPGYQGEMCVGFQEPMVWRIAEIISLCTYIYFAICFVLSKRSMK